MSEIGTNTGVYMTTETDAWPLIPEEVSKSVVSGVTEKSAALSLFRKLPNLSSRTYRMPVLDSIAAAYFTGTTTDDNLIAGADVQIDSARMAQMIAAGYIPKDDAPGLKKTHQMEWNNVYIVAEPIAIILPIPEDVLDDSQYPIWDELRPRIIEAFHQTIDRAIIWGQGRPVTWPTGIVPTAINRGFVLQEGATAGQDLSVDVSDLMGLLEVVGYDPTGFMADPSVKASLRGLRSTTNELIFQPSMQVGTPATLYALPINYVKNATFMPAVTRIIAGDMSKALWAMRMDMRYKLLTEGVITDSDNKIVLNLAQQDMVALRCVMRLGWAVPNPIHKLAPDYDRDERYPFAVLTAPAT